MLCKEIDMKLYIIANRLPVKVAGTNGKFAFSKADWQQVWILFRLLMRSTG